MDFIDEKLVQYSLSHSTSQSSLLEQIEKETYENVSKPYMISGNLQGRWLSFLTKCIKPISILEIGTYTGFSALCMLEGLQENGVIDTLEANAEYAFIAQKYFNMHERGKDIHVHIGEAVETLDKLGKTYDLIFIDADKINYTTYYKKAITMLNEGGIILIDNTLRYGKILNQDYVINDLDTKSISDCNEYIKNDSSVECLLLPIRDGMTLIRKQS